MSDRTPLQHFRYKARSARALAGKLGRSAERSGWLEIAQQYDLLADTVIGLDERDATLPTRTGVPFRPGQARRLGRVSRAHF